MTGSAILPASSQDLTLGLRVNDLKQLGFGCVLSNCKVRRTQSYLYIKLFNEYPQLKN